MQGNSTDWKQIYQEHSPKLLGICRRYVQDIYAAEDIVQDSFITAIQKVHQLKDEKLLFAWLKKIMVNNALLYLKKRTRETFIETETLEITEIQLAMSENMEEKAPVLAYDFTREELLSSIDSLPTHHKSVFNLFFIENYSHTEIAGMLGISVNTSKSHLLRAKRSIQNYLVSSVLHPDTPRNKKKITQLLVFLGFGSLLWAQTFKSRFSDFSVQPSKSFEIQEHIQIKNINFQSSSAISWKTKIIGVVGLLVILLGSVMLFSPNSQNMSYQKDTGTQGRKTVRGKEEIKPESAAQTVSNTNTEGGIHKESTKNNILEKTTVTEQNTSKMKQSKTKISVKDSVESISKKIIVVRKIIQRDTIYVER